MQHDLHAASTWTEKVVLITGASEGIGESCARAFSQRGAKLVLTGLPDENFKDEESDIRLVIPGDITSKETRIKVVMRAIDRFGQIDVLINNAGVGQYGYPTEADTEISKRMFDINVFSALALTQLVVPHMKARRCGTIVNVGSVGGDVSLPWAVMYCATKHAVHCIDDSLRRELQGTGIHVMKVCPGIVATRFRHHVLGWGRPWTRGRHSPRSEPGRGCPRHPSGCRAQKAEGVRTQNRLAFYFARFFCAIRDGLVPAKKILKIMRPKSPSKLSQRWEHGSY